MEGFRQLQDKHDLIGDVRGKGLMTGVELVKDRQSKAPATAETQQACLALLLLMRTAYSLLSSDSQH